jgi:hypothetical protein
MDEKYTLGLVHTEYRADSAHNFGENGTSKTLVYKKMAHFFDKSSTDRSGLLKANADAIFSMIQLSPYSSKATIVGGGMLNASLNSI